MTVPTQIIHTQALIDTAGTRSCMTSPMAPSMAPMVSKVATIIRNHSHTTHETRKRGPGMRSKNLQGVEAQ